MALIACLAYRDSCHYHFSVDVWDSCIIRHRTEGVFFGLVNCHSETGYSKDLEHDGPELGTIFQVLNTLRMVVAGVAK